MTIDESTLLAYVDGALSAQQRARVEAALAHDPALRAQVDTLRASCLPYQSAYALVATPAMPGSLESRVASLIAVAGGTPTHSALSMRQWMWTGAAVAASFMLGVVAPALIAKPEITQAAQSLQATPWVEAIASYQALYVRATVDQAPDTASRARQVLAEFAVGSSASAASATASSSASATAINVPDLREVGLTFKRIQRLGYGDLPLLQMVYLPTEGKPAALCVLPVRASDRQADAPLQMRHIDGLAVATWQKAGLAYVLTADMSQSKAEAIARRIAAEAFATLYQSAS